MHQMRPNWLWFMVVAVLERPISSIMRLMMRSLSLKLRVCTTPAWLLNLIILLRPCGNTRVMTHGLCQRAGWKPLTNSRHTLKTQGQVVSACYSLMSYPGWTHVAAIFWKHLNGSGTVGAAISQICCSSSVAVQPIGLSTSSLNSKVAYIIVQAARCFSDRSP